MKLSILPIDQVAVSTEDCLVNAAIWWTTGARFLWPGDWWWAKLSLTDLFLRIRVEALPGVVMSAIDASTEGGNKKEKEWSFRSSVLFCFV